MVEEERFIEKTEAISPLMASLALAFWRMKGAFEREVGVSAGTWFSLAMLIEEDGISQGELGHKFEVDPSRTTRLAQRLEREGLLRRERDPADNRVVRLHVTEKGQRLIETTQARRERFENRIRRELSDKELQEFRRLLGVVARVMKD
ncbi:MAG: MarR family transcriptional regulator [Actinomycetota bacterium]|nr:MarR family transcriptional regulator [Actinomycetota bacterium]